MIEILNQAPNDPLDALVQIVYIYAATRGYLDNLPVAKVAAFKKYVRLDIQELIELAYSHHLGELMPAVETSFESLTEFYSQLLEVWEYDDLVLALLEVGSDIEN